MKMYKTNLYTLEIQEREITRQTAHFLFWQDGRKERREVKLGFSHKWHESRLDALRHLHLLAVRKASEGQRLLNEAEREMYLIQIELKHLKD